MIFFSLNLPEEVQAETMLALQLLGVKNTSESEVARQRSGLEAATWVASGFGSL